jgi:DNA polymerase-3 subunit epsilon
MAPVIDRSGMFMGFLEKFRSQPTGSASSHAFAHDATPKVATGVPIGEPRFAVIDVETTGLNAEQHRIVEIAVVTTDPWGRVLGEWSTRVNPQGPVGATHIHGITELDVAKAPVFAEVIAQLNQCLAGAAVAAHHAKFDLAFLRAEYRRAGWDMPLLPALCTLEASEYHLPMLDRRRLADCCWAVGTPLHGAHSAIGDARATAVLLSAFMHPQVGYPPLPEHVAMPGEALAVSWPPGPSQSPLAVATSKDSRARSAPPPRVQAVLAEQAAAKPAPALVELVERFSLIDALDEGAPAGAMSYLEKLAEVLEDGEVTSQEADDLAGVADAEQLTNADIATANQAFVLALAHAALEDGEVTRAERAELQAVSDLLGVNSKVIPALLDRAENARNQRMSMGLKDLPDDWTHGEPLRVGDKVVFTGCEDTTRRRLEAESEQVGGRIIGGVSAKTALLVTDGTMDGTKAAKARELGTRTVHPDIYAVLLAHLQPAVARGTKPLPKAPRPALPRHAASRNKSPASESIATTAMAPNPAEVRAWARANGIEVGVRGRLQKELIDAYLASQAN